MAENYPRGQITLSVLDRLIDEDPKRSVEAPKTRAQLLRELKAALRRDLEWLLNTRVPPGLRDSLPPELARSVYCYGLPDQTSLSQDGPAGAEELIRRIESVVTLFEPRLMDVRVSLAPAQQEFSQRTAFVIEGLLRVDPRPERVTFDTMRDQASGEFRIQGEPGGR